MNTKGVTQVRLLGRIRVANKVVAVVEQHRTQGLAYWEGVGPETKLYDLPVKFCVPPRVAKVVRSIRRPKTLIFDMHAEAKDVEKAVKRFSKAGWVFVRIDAH